MTETDHWAPIPLRWRHVREGDVIIGADGRPWVVTRTDALGRGIVTARRGDGEDGVHSAPVDPDDVVRVLVPATERAAMRSLREGLDARVVDREVS